MMTTSNDFVEGKREDSKDPSLQADHLSNVATTSEMIGNVVDPALAAKTNLLNEVS